MAATVYKLARSALYTALTVFTQNCVYILDILRVWFLDTTKGNNEALFLIQLKREWVWVNGFVENECVI